MKKKLWIVVIILMFASIYLISSSYALFESDSSGLINSDIGQWTIKLNDYLISDTSEVSFDVDNFQYAENIHTVDGYIAPGRNGYFDVILDPKGTQVAVKYDISLNMENAYAENISLNVNVSNGQDVIRTAENTYSGVFSLEDIENEETITLRISIEWLNDVNYDVSDTEFGLTGGNISIPVTVNVTQYNGEEIVPYTE